MGRLFQIQLKSGYREIPSLWTAVVGPSGSGKTPVMNAVFEPIRRLQSQADQIYKEQLAEYEKEIEQYDEWKKSRKQKTEIVPPQEKPVAPIPEQVLIDDATIQAVAEILEQNPYGAILPQDELSGFINGFDIYQRGSGGKDLAFWCSIFNGVPIRHNRKTGRKVFSAPTPAVAICGGIQPGILKKAICENPHFLDIGFNARIQIGRAHV